MEQNGYEQVPSMPNFCSLLHIFVSSMLLRTHQLGDRPWIELCNEKDVLDPK